MAAEPDLSWLYAAGEEKLEPLYSEATVARRRGPSSVTSTAERARGVRMRSHGGFPSKNVRSGDGGSGGN
jgi:hypothetical protein